MSFSPFFYRGETASRAVKIRWNNKIDKYRILKLKNIKLKNKSLIEWKIKSSLTKPFESSIQWNESKDLLKKDFSRRSFHFPRPRSPVSCGVGDGGVEDYFNPFSRTLKKTFIFDWIKNTSHSAVLNPPHPLRGDGENVEKIKFLKQPSERVDVNPAKEIWLKKKRFLKQNKKHRRNFENQFKKNLYLYSFISKFLSHIPQSFSNFRPSYNNWSKSKNPFFFDSNRQNYLEILQNKTSNNKKSLPLYIRAEDDKTAIRFVFSGRLNGVRMKRKFSAYNGNISTQTFSINSNYIQKNIYTKWGVLGLRIWNRSNFNPYLSGNRRSFSLSCSLLNTQLSKSYKEDFFSSNSQKEFKNNFKRGHLSPSFAGPPSEGDLNPIKIGRSAKLPLLRLKKYNPTTPSLRHRLVLKSLPSQSSSISRNRIRKKFLINKRILFKGFKKTSGRNNQGRITSFRKGGGHKKLYRYIDHFNNNSLFSKAVVINIENNPYSNANLALLKIKNSIISSKSLIKQNKILKSSQLPLRKRAEDFFFYIIAPEQLQIGDEIKGLFFNQIKKSYPHLLEEKAINKETTPSEGAPQNGELYFLKDIPVGTYISNVEIQKGKGSQIARSAGTYCVLLKTLDNNKSIIKLPSNKIIEVNSECTATIGQVSNSLFRSRILGKAGAARWLGIRPRTRGEAMNAVDHPHGGKNHGPGGLRNQPKNRWGKLAKWRRTSSK